MKSLYSFFLTLLVSISVIAHSPYKNTDVKIKTTYVAGNVYMLEGDGGNIGLSVGDDGILIIDDQYDILSDKIKQAIKKINSGKIKFLFNTHHHSDHTGGNKNFGKDATIIAHHNVRKRLTSDKDKAAHELPVITFKENISVHFNDEEIKAIHLKDGHTDGDAAIYFSKSNVLHMGDQFFNGGLPYIDLDSGGNAEKYAENIEYILNVVPEDVKIIPGHGPLATISDLKKLHTMVSENVNYVKGLIKEDKTLEQVQSMGVLEPYKKEANNWMTEELWLKILYNSLKQKSLQK